MVVLGSGGELDVVGYALVGMDDGVDLDAAFLPARLGIAPHTLENQVREQADGRRIDDLQPFHPLRHLAGEAVRGKSVLVALVQVHVDLPEDSLVPP